MQMSNRISGFQCSPIRRLVPYARDAKSKGIHVIHLNIGQPDIKTPVEAIKAIQDYDDEIIEYGISEGEPYLRKALLSYYRKYGLSLSEDDILITTGGSEAIQFMFTTLCDPFDEFIIPEPFYTNVATFANMAMVTLRPVTSSSDDNFVLPSIADFEKRINKKTMGILLCSPNNPTGHVYSTEELSKTFTSVLSFPEYQDRVICIDSFSKRFSMCGSRIGAIVTRNREVLDSALKLAQARLCPPVVEQRAAAAALTAPDEYVENVRAEYERRRNVLISHMQRIPGVRCSLPKGAFYFVADLPVDDAERFALFMLRDFSYEGNTVMFAPAEDFYVTKGLGRNQARFAYVLNENELVMAAKCLEAGLKAYRRTVMGLKD